jgi:putative addiction module component (TIGR02574 family)
MSAKLETMKSEALHLAPRERLELANTLLASVEPESSDANAAAWETEIRRRIAEFDAGRVESIPGQDVFDDLDRRLGR